MRRVHAGGGSLLGAALLTALLAGPALGQTFTWNVVNGSFQNAANWTPAGGPPGATTTAAFTTAGTFQSTFDSDWTLNTLNLSLGTVTFNMNGRTLTSSFHNIGTIAGQNVTWVVTDGTYISTTVGASIGTAANTTTMTLRDGSTYSSLGSTNLGTGTSANVTVNVRDGSRYLNGDGLGGSFIGSAASATGTINVLGSGSTARLSANSRIGNLGSGTINIDQGGLLETRGSLELAANVGSTGVVNLTGTGSTWNHADGYILPGTGATKTIVVGGSTTLNVTGMAAAAGINLSSGTLTVNNGGMLNVSGLAGSNLNVNGGTATLAGAVNVSGSGNGVNLTAGTLNLNTGAVLTTTNFTRSGAATIVWSSGSLTVDGGVFDNSGAGFIVGQGSLTFQNGATSAGIQNLNVQAAGAGGTLNVRSGAVLAVTGDFKIATGATTGTVLVDGTGSALTVAGGGAVIGDGGNGTMIVQNGGRFSANPASTDTYVGADGTGSLTVTGAGSSFSTWNLNLGGGAGASNSSLVVSAGGSLSSFLSNIGNLAGNVANVTITGAGSTWAVGERLTISGVFGSAGGAGTLTIANGGAVTVAGPNTTLTSAAGATLTLNGGSLTTLSFIRLGTFNFNDGTLAVTGGTFQNGAAASALTINGSSATANPTLTLSGATTTTSNIAAFTLGNGAAATLNVQNGATLTASSVQIGSANGSNGVANLSGPNATLTSSGTLTVGLNAAGQGTLNLGTGATATAATTFTLNTPGTVNLNGGTLQAGALALNGGTFNWNSGTVRLTTATALSDADLTALLGTSHSLNTGKWKTFQGGGLMLNGNLWVDGGNLTGDNLTNNATLVLSSGATAVSGTFTNNAGRLTVLQNLGNLTATTFSNSGTLNLNGAATTIAANLTNNAGGLIFGTGTVNGNLTNNGTVRATGSERLTFVGTGHTNNLNLQLVGGTLEFLAPLTVAGTGAITGRGTLVTTGNFPGTPGLTINSGGVLTASASTFDVYGDTNLTAGSRVGVAGNGILTFYDDVVQNATEFRIFGASRAVFFGDVTGAGNFQGSTGNVDFFSDYRPGNSPALVTFEGDLNLYGTTTLFIELGGLARGTQYDALDVVGQMQVGGDLVVSSLSGFTPTFGNTFVIANRGSGFGQFTGLAEGASLFAAGGAFRISYQGIDYSTGLLAPGATNTSIVLSAVPEPLTLALFGLAGAGSGGTWWWCRRREQIEVAESEAEDDDQERGE